MNVGGNNNDDENDDDVDDDDDEDCKWKGRLKLVPCFAVSQLQVVLPEATHLEAKALIK